jgi:DNA primase
MELQVRSGLVVEREGGRLVDRFRNRLMIPIARDSGAVVAFGGRALEEGQVPKYLNSPETPIYTKGRTLYGLDVTKAAIRKHNYCVLVEGYFDLAQVYQAGIQPVVASCGTALTSMQARVLKRFTEKVVLSFDPDAAGQNAASRSSEMLVSEGFQVNVALLPAGADPDSFVQKNGGRAYVEKLKSSQSYLDYLLDRSAAKHDLHKPEGRRAFLNEMLTVAATIPEAADRDHFADRLAHKARVTEGVLRDEIRKAAAAKKKEAPAIAVRSSVRLLPAEQGLLWALAHRPVEGLAAVGQLEPEDLDGLAAGATLQLAASLADVPPDFLPALLRERLSETERAAFEKAVAATAPPASPADCVNALRLMRLKRDLAGVQEEIDRLEERGKASNDALATLWARKKALLQQLQELKA